MKIIDVGCGPGIYVDAFKKAGIDAIGVDIDKNSPCVVMDVFSDEFMSFTGFDLCLCLEVAEHIDESLSDKLIKRLINTSDVIVFSAAQPGQGGHGHINCQPKSYWIDKFEKNNYILDNQATEKLVSFMLNGVHMGWFVNNVMVFKSYSNIYYKTIIEEETPQAERIAEFFSTNTVF
jgi:hypothetical protein